MHGGISLMTGVGDCSSFVSFLANHPSIHFSLAEFDE